ncbi:MAG: SPOR domain-containing protein [Treponema sp.]|nr:SPOR domain-containing protein [Treponema sp.]
MKLKVFLLLAAATLFLMGSTPWEGAASVAPAGELPATGFFVATNSFPRNTVVNITNIETGKSTRAIVANTLNSPGLLAIVSREAADLIGMRQGSVSRIRMIQPSDPIAYLRFTENLMLGNPPFDSGSVIDEDSLLAEVYGSDSYIPVPADIWNQEQASPPAAGISGPSYIIEPEWGGTGRLSIVDIPVFNIEPVERFNIEEENPFLAEEHPPLIAEETQGRFTDDDLKIDNEEIFDFIADNFWDNIEQPVLIAEDESNEIINDFLDRDYIAYNLVETTEQPPSQNIYGINPDDIIPAITSAQKPIIVPEQILPAQPVPAAPEHSFSVRTISHLDRGQYYVQLAVLSADSIENAVRQIDRSYDPFIFRDTSNTYRILIGPLNQGESAAVLSRFRSIGYRDAFVRRGG